MCRLVDGQLATQSPIASFACAPVRGAYLLGSATSKLHAYGPIGLRGADPEKFVGGKSGLVPRLTSYSWSRSLTIQPWQKYNYDHALEIHQPPHEGVYLRRCCRFPGNRFRGSFFASLVLRPSLRTTAVDGSRKSFAAP